MPTNPPFHGGLSGERTETDTEDKIDMVASRAEANARKGQEAISSSMAPDNDRHEVREV